MPFFENIILKVPVEIKSSPEKVFEYLTGIVDDASFKTLNADNISFRWLKGDPWTVGSIACAEKYLHGKPHSFRFVVTGLVVNRHIEYIPTSKLIRVFFPKKEFIIAKTDNGCLLTSSATFRIGWIGKKFFKKKIDDGLSSFRVYLQEEGKNLKKMLEELQS
jgi:hypothetical protein